MFLADLPAYETEEEQKDTFTQVEKKEDLQAYLMSLMNK
ncbi:hypothetical protein EVA_11300 [gut metagenome]|uniref:Uncharacterized protein n=1 Tax=gut metagenome TaxID=749906 RepID=J9G193_9ZZZZ